MADTHHMTSESINQASVPPSMFGFGAAHMAPSGVAGSASSVNAAAAHAASATVESASAAATAYVTASAMTADTHCSYMSP